jgi:colicin import membrane protein
MQAHADRLQFAPPPPPGMLRAIVLALIAHLLLLLALGWGINWKREPQTISAEAELWSSLPQEAAPRLVEPPPPPPVVATPPPPAPVVKEQPKPEPGPTQADIALERRKEKLAEKKAEEKRRQIALEREKKREAEKQKQLEAKRELEERRKQELAKAKAAEDKQKVETAKKLKLAEDGKRMEAQRQTNLDRMKGLAGATGAPTATGTALRSSGPSASYAGRVAARVKPNIVFTEDIAGNPRAEIEVRTAPDGTIVGQRILKSSGVKGWDDAVLKAVIKTEVLPRDTDGRVPSPLIIDFRPKD